MPAGRKAIDNMKVSKTLLIAASVLAFDISLFQAAISFSPGWSAAFGTPSELVANPPLLLATGLLASVLLGVLGLYGLSGSGVIRRLPLLRLALLCIGLGYALRGSALVPQLLVLGHIVSAPQPIIIQPVTTSAVMLVTGLLFLAGLASGWKYLAVHERGAARGSRAANTDRMVMS